MFQSPKEPDLLRIEHVMGFSFSGGGALFTFGQSCENSHRSEDQLLIRRGCRRSGRARGVPK